DHRSDDQVCHYCRTCHKTSGITYESTTCDFTPAQLYRVSRDARQSGVRNQLWCGSPHSAIFVCMLRVSFTLLIAAHLAAAQDAALNWMPVTSAKVDVAGLPWFQENHGEFWRLPVRSKDTFPKEVWNLALDPTGGRIRFRTDSSSVALRLEWPHPPGMRNMHFFGQSG